MKYSSEEVCKMVGISNFKLKDLTRSRKTRNKEPIFSPECPGSRGIPSYFSEADVNLLKEYCRTLKTHRAVVEKLRRANK